MKKLILALCLLLSGLAAAGAWDLLPMERLIAESDLVVICKLSYIMRGDPGPQARNPATAPA